MVSGGVMLRQAVVGLMGRRLVEGGRPGMLKRGPMVVGIIWVRSLGLLARMRLLRRVVDIVIWSYTVVARQRASNTWVPPERTALAGRRTLNGNNLSESSPAGLGVPEAAARFNPRLGGPATLPLYPSANLELRRAVLDSRLWPVEGKAHVVVRRSSKPCWVNQLRAVAAATLGTLFSCEVQEPGPTAGRNSDGILGGPSSTAHCL
jgi:hypothetical protein